VGATSAHKKDFKMNATYWANYSEDLDKGKEEGTERVAEGEM
jgi:hypothetical protein